MLKPKISFNERYSLRSAAPAVTDEPDEGIDSGSSFEPDSLILPKTRSARKKTGDAAKSSRKSSVRPPSQADHSTTGTYFMLFGSCREANRNRNYHDRRTEEPPINTKAGLST